MTENLNKIDYQKIINYAIASLMLKIKTDRPEEIKNDTEMSEKEKERLIAKTDAFDKKLCAEIESNKVQFVSALQNFCDENPSPTMEEIANFVEENITSCAVNIIEAEIGKDIRREVS